MTTTVHTQETTAIAVVYPVTSEDIERRRAEYAALTFDNPQNYATGTKAIAHCRETRGLIEQRRVELKKDSLEYGRKVDRVAKELTQLIESIENPLKLKKAIVDDEKARIKREAEEAKRREVEAEIRAKREAEEARLRAEREAEDKRLAEERARLKVEADRLEAARRQAEADAALERAKQAAAQRAERAKLDAEKAALEAERRAVAVAKQLAERAEFERQAKIRAEQEAKERTQRERIAAEEARVRELERKASEERRLEAIRPDLEKVHSYGAQVRKLIEAAPTLADPSAVTFLAFKVSELQGTARSLEEFGPIRPATVPYPQFCYMPGTCLGKDRCQAPIVCND